MIGNVVKSCAAKTMTNVTRRSMTHMRAFTTRDMQLPEIMLMAF